MKVLAMATSLVEAPRTATVAGANSGRKVSRGSGARLGGGAAAGSRHDQRIEVEFGHRVGVPHQEPVRAADPEHYVDQRVGVDGGLAAKAGKQRMASEFAEHRASLRRVDRADAEGDVLQHLNQDAAEADHDHRSELRIAQAADHDLAAGWDHLLDQPSLHASLGDGGFYRHRLDRGAYCPSVPKPERDASRIRFV